MYIPESAKRPAWLVTDRLELQNRDGPPQLLLFSSLNSAIPSEFNVQPDLVTTFSRKPGVERVQVRDNFKPPQVMTSKSDVERLMSKLEHPDIAMKVLWVWMLQKFQHKAFHTRRSCRRHLFAKEHDELKNNLRSASPAAHNDKECEH